MSSVLLEAIILASSGILSIGSMTITILLLLTPKGLMKGISYALGYIMGYSIIGITTILFQYQLGSNFESEPSRIPYIILILLGCLLLYLSAKNYHKHPSAEQKENKLFRVVDGITPLKAFGFGMFVIVINFKNFALFMSALSVILLSDLMVYEKLLFTEVIVLVFCTSVLFPIFVYILSPQIAETNLNRIKDWLNRNGRSISIWAPLIFGSLFIIKGGIELL